jgi:hypothetical protein
LRSLWLQLRHSHLPLPPQPPPCSAPLLSTVIQRASSQSLRR